MTDLFTSQRHPLQRPNIPGGSFFDTSLLSLASPLQIQPRAVFFSRRLTPSLGWDSYTETLPGFPWQGTQPHLLSAESQVSACLRAAAEAALCPDVCGARAGSEGFPAASRSDLTKPGSCRTVTWLAECLLLFFFPTRAVLPKTVFLCRARFATTLVLLEQQINI